MENSNYTEKEIGGDDLDNKLKKRIPWNKGLTAKTDERVARNIENIKKAIFEKYGVENISTYVSKQDGYRVWNKGLTKESDARVKKASDSHKGNVAWNNGLTSETDDRIKCTKRPDCVREKIRKLHLTPSVQQKRFDTMKKNGTLGVNQDTVAELEYLKKLLEKYSADDIEHPYMDKERYPFKCDFYIKSEDKFIEVHGNWTHGGMPFDKNNEQCLKQLELWKDKSNTSKYYKNAIYTWTDLDVRKVKIAEENNLNFEVVYYKYK